MNINSKIKDTKAEKSEMRHVNEEREPETQKMITRNNYEEYFLLYADEELTTQQRRAVELFAAENPDLAGELSLLQQLRVSPEEEIVFGNKASLLKTSVLDDIAVNYEEYFLLYIDNELTEAQKAEVEKFVLQHPRYQQEFTLLKQTVLVPEHVRLANKETLLQHHKTPERAASFNFMRMAAAAAFIGAAFLTWWLFKPRQNDMQVATNSATEQQRNPEKEVIQQPATNETPFQKQNQLAGARPDKLKATENRLQADKNSTSAEKNNKKIEPKKYADKEFLIADQKPAFKKQNESTEHDKQLQELSDSKAINDNADAKMNNDGADEQMQNDIAFQNNHSGNSIIPVAYKEINTSEEDRSLYVGNLNLNKDKVKNLFKKAGRLFGDKAREYSNDDGKLQVANLEFESNK